MKKILILFFVLLCAKNYSQQNIIDVENYNHNNLDNVYYKDFTTYQNFTGTWQSINGNNTFRLILWKSTHEKMPGGTNSYQDLIFGRYLIIQNAGSSNEQVLYDSVRYFPQNGYTSSRILLAYAINTIGFSGTFTDTHANGGDGVLEGWFKLEKINNTNQAKWEVSPDSPLKPGESFTVSTNCILTKVN
jgi:hypothetical protein